MLNLLSRISTVIRLTRAGRGQELDRVLTAMDRGSRFHGASGAMLLAMAPYKRHSWMELSLAACRARSDDDLEVIGRAWARRLEKHIRATRDEPPHEGE